MRGSKNFSRGGGGGGLTKKSSVNVFFCFFFSPQLILQKSNSQFQRNLSILRFQRGPNISRGVQLFPGGGGGGVQVLIPYRNPYNL